MDLVVLLKEFGPLVGIIIFFIWRDWKREDNLIERVQKLEDFNTEVLMTMVKETTATIAANTAQLTLMTEMMSNCRANQDE